MSTNEQLQAIAKYADLAENGTMRPSDRQDLKHLLAVIRQQAAKLDAVERLLDEKYKLWAAICGNTCSKDIVGVDHEAIADEVAAAIRAAVGGAA